MPSQEDYLDSLLKDVTASDELQEDVSDQGIATPDLDAVTEMSIDFIFRHFGNSI